MKRRTTKLKVPTEDKRGVAIYARKSVITHKGDSTGVQIKQSSDYACSQLSLPQDYDFTIYMDKGLSGYYSDRPDFQRMLKDIELHKIRAVVCYKLDRISRKTSDLLRLMDFFDKYHVVLLVCSNNINTNISTSKIMISFLAIIAEFERDILTERVTDNLVELSKDGRWMGGTEPTGYDRYRVSVGTGKNKTAVTHLKTIPEEKKMVVDIYETFLRLRSLNQATKEIRTRWKTKRGSQHTTISLKTILRNPTYCIADQDAYEYFYDNNASICMEDKFDGTHGVSTYNRRSEMKVEHDDSTFFKPKFTSVHVDKDIEEWLVSVGQHEGFISGKNWVRTQFLLDDLADHFNRPHLVSHALLAGKVYCPACGRRMQVFAESDRVNEDGTMRFKYGCPNQRVKKICTQKSIRGKELDDFVIKSLSDLSKESNKYYLTLMDRKMTGAIQSDSTVKELAVAKKELERLEKDVAAQVRNLREADETIRTFIQNDISQLSEEMNKKKEIIKKLEEKVNSDQDVSDELTEVRKTLLNFSDLMANSSYEEKLGIIASIVDRVTFRYTATEQFCHIFIKGNTDEMYDDFFGSDGPMSISNYLKEDESAVSPAGPSEEMCNLDQYRQCGTDLCRS